MRASFVAVAVGVWACGRVWALTSLGTYFITGPEYLDREPYGREITRFKLSTDNAASPMAVLECGRRCLATPRCSSMALRPKKGLCYLYHLDLCASPWINLRFDEGKVFYDLVSGADAAQPQTCFRMCLTKNNGKCSSCGFPFCDGNLCRRCPQRCWELSPPVTRSINLWSAIGNRYRARCEGKWQLLWPNVKTQLTQKGLELRVKVIYEDETVLTYLYSDVELKSGKLTVGSPANSSLNWWGAPFASRNISTMDNSSNCFEFFYPPGECQANGVPSIEEQNLTTGSEYQRGFAWRTGEGLRDAMKVLNIELWVTRH